MMGINYKEIFVFIGNENENWNTIIIIKNQNSKNKIDSPIRLSSNQEKGKFSRFIQYWNNREIFIRSILQAQIKIFYYNYTTISPKSRHLHNYTENNILVLPFILVKFRHWVLSKYINSFLILY